MYPILYDIQGKVLLYFPYSSNLTGVQGGKCDNWLWYGDRPNPNPLCCLELVKKFVVVVGGGGGWWWVCKPILVLSLGFDQAEQ